MPQVGGTRQSVGVASTETVSLWLTGAFGLVSTVGVAYRVVDIRQRGRRSPAPSASAPAVAASTATSPPPVEAPPTPFPEPQHQPLPGSQQTSAPPYSAPQQSASPIQPAQTTPQD